MRLLIISALSVFLSGCVENYYACRSQGMARDYCDLTTQAPPSGGVTGQVPIRSVAIEAHAAAGGT
jgi:hypothetical protein